ncbi:MAG: putative manganese-dependent inorganic diphosphatase [Methanomicrobiales archaeon]|nr:putative manganese-dependent inorganic diphosphatase [Methanomicrobiales archaeon]
MGEPPVIVIGHRQPDMDSIGSVIGYTELLSRTGTGTFRPMRCGEMNAETLFALERFGAEAPDYIESVEPTVSDLPFLETRHVCAELPTIDAVQLMERHGMRNMPVTNAMGQLLGLISEYGLARAYIKSERGEALSLPPIDVETLARILDAEIRVMANRVLSGRVYTTIDALHVALSKLLPQDIAIVGDNEPAQLAFISAGIAAIIIADGAPVGERVTGAARQKGVSILSTPLDAFSVGKLCNLSLPASLVMETDVPRVSMDDPLEYVKYTISNSKFRTACVVDRSGRFIGQISRSTLMQDVQKKVILLDHNEPDQAVEGIEKAEILEIIDHHRLSAITTLKPVRFLNDPVGSTSTIITHKFIESGVKPGLKAAGLLLSGILSDTLVLRMSTTTPQDEKAVGYLAELIGIDPFVYGKELIQRGMGLDGIPMNEVLTRDMKRYRLFEREVIISQVMLPSFDYSRNHAVEIAKELERLRESYRADFFIVLFTSIMDGASEVFAASDETSLHRTGFSSQPVLMEGVMSRKKDFLPRFGELLRER